MLGFACLGLIGSGIAGAIICGTRSAKVVLEPPMPKAVIDAMLVRYNKSVRYRDQKAFYSMIMGWIAFFFLFISLILTIMAGLHYRRVARERRASGGSNPFNEKVHETHSDRHAGHL